MELGKVGRGGVKVNGEEMTEMKRELHREGDGSRERYWRKRRRSEGRKR